MNLAPVSIGIPAYQAADTIERCLASCRGQSAGVPEVVLVDNNCTDGTVEVARRWARNHGLPLRVVVEPIQGSGPARNAAVPFLNLDFVVWLDADDRLHPHAIAAHLERLRDVPGSTPAISHGHVVVESPQENFIELLTLWTSSRPLVDSVLGKRWLPPAGYMLNRAAFERLHAVGGFLATRAQDTEYFLRAQLLGMRHLEVGRIVARYRSGALHQATTGRTAEGWADDIATALSHARALALREGVGLNEGDTEVLEPSIWTRLVGRKHAFSRSGELQWIDGEARRRTRAFDAVDRAILIAARNISPLTLATMTARACRVMPPLGADPLRVLRAARVLWQSDVFHRLRLEGPPE